MFRIPSSNQGPEWDSVGRHGLKNTIKQNQNIFVREMCFNWCSLKASIELLKSLSWTCQYWVVMECLVFSERIFCPSIWGENFLPFTVRSGLVWSSRRSYFTLPDLTTLLMFKFSTGTGPILQSYRCPIWHVSVVKSHWGWDQCSLKRMQIWSPHFSRKLQLQAWAGQHQAGLGR